jgi:hypothetical protein
VLGEGTGEVTGEEQHTRPHSADVRSSAQLLGGGQLVQGVVEAAVADGPLRRRHMAVAMCLDTGEKR